ncbi:MAG: endolytic transglycosylase MltG [Pseudomonadota bacterium]
MSLDEIEPERPQRSKAARNGFVFLFNLAISGFFLLALMAGVALYFGKQTFEAPGPLAEEQTLLINRGEGVSTIAAKLERAGVIEDDFVFRAGIRAYRNDVELKAGEYKFEPGDSMKSVMDRLVAGRSIQYLVTIPEGFTTARAYARVAANETLTGDMPLLVDEGALLPDTYSFQRGESRADVINRMVAARDKVVAEIWENRQPDLPISTPEEMVTLASIVQMEAGGSEFREVAGVFVNRLNKGMRLESDPTILYGIYGGEGKPRVNGRVQGITQTEKANRHAYNTYFIEGLPPGPITNPGRESLEAVANPAQTDAFFFVADGTGGHAFSVTYAEHLENVAKWREIEAEIAARRAAEDAEANTAESDQASDG